MIRHIASVKNTHSVCVSAVRFEPIPWSHGWKVLDWQRGVYVPRLWDTERLAKRYASRRNNAHRAATAPRFVIGAGGAWMPVCEGLNQ